MDSIPQHDEMTQSVIDQLCAVINRQPGPDEYPGIEQCIVTALIVCAAELVKRVNPEHRSDAIAYFQQGLAERVSNERERPQ